MTSLLSGNYKNTFYIEKFVTWAHLGSQVRKVTWEISEEKV